MTSWALQLVRQRAAALRAMRRWFDDEDFVEVATHQLLPAPSTEPHIDPLVVQVATDLTQPHLTSPRYLHTSPELALKRVLALGADRVFSLARVFRDGEVSPRHLPEFDMLEWYRTGAPLTQLQDDCMALLRAVVDAVEGNPALDVDTFDVASCHDLFAAHADVDLRASLVALRDGDVTHLARQAHQAGHAVRVDDVFEDVFHHLMGTRVEVAIGQERPCFVTRWPYSMAVFSKLCADDDLFAERFEMYACGLELANAFDEVTDVDEQRARFDADLDERRALGKPDLPVDEDFLQALAHMPPTSGIALGWERLLMVALDVDDIQQVQPLPWR